MNGSTTKKMVLVNLTLDMEMLTKVTFTKTTKMDKELFPINQVLNLTVTGNKMWQMEKVSWIIQMMIITKENF